MARVFEIEQQNGACRSAAVPGLVLDGVAKDQCPPLFPRARFVSHPQRTIRVRLQRQMQSKNVERKKVIDFSIPYGVIQIVIAAPKTKEIKGIKEMAGMRIGTTRGTTNDKEATDQAQGADIVRYDDDATLITALVSGQVDIMASSPQTMVAVNARRTKDPLELKLVLKTNPYAIGLRKDDDALRKVLNDWVAKNLANGKLSAIYAKYNGAPLPAEMPK